MRHHNQNRKFGRESGLRRALLRSLAVSLITRGRIRTTEARAKSLRPFVERLVTLSKRNNVSSRRLIIARLGEKGDMAEKLAKTIAPRYTDRPGGYTRITKVSSSRTDAANMAIVEFV
jgi:large subunit ribosomal protein L17